MKTICLAHEAINTSQAWSAIKYKLICIQHTINIFIYTFRFDTQAHNRFIFILIHNFRSTNAVESNTLKRGKQKECSL